MDFVTQDSMDYTIQRVYEKIAQLEAIIRRLEQRIDKLERA